MAYQIENGDYVKKSGNADFQSITYIDEVLQNAKILLTTDRGSFYPNKNFGSQINQSTAKPINEYALAYARQALENLNGVYVKSSSLDNNLLTVDLIINDEERQVSVDIG